MREPPSTKHHQLKLASGQEKYAGTAISPLRAFICQAVYDVERIPVDNSWRPDIHIVYMEHVGTTNSGILVHWLDSWFGNELWLCHKSLRQSVKPKIGFNCCYIESISLVKDSKLHKCRAMALRQHWDADVLAYHPRLIPWWCGLNFTGGLRLIIWHKASRHVGSLVDNLLLQILLLVPRSSCRTSIQSDR